jgi:hypothetical protein
MSSLQLNSNRKTNRRKLIELRYAMADNTSTNFNTNFNLNNLLSSFSDGSLEISIGLNNLQSQSQTNSQAKKDTEAVSEDTFASAINKIGVLKSSDGFLYLIKPNDQIKHDKESNQVYILRKTLFGYEKKYISGDPKNLKLIFPLNYSGVSQANIEDKSIKYQNGDQLISKVDSNGDAKLYIKRKNSSGEDQLIEVTQDPLTGKLVLVGESSKNTSDKSSSNNSTNTTTSNSSSPIAGSDVQKSIDSIGSKGQLWSALGLPPGIRPATVNVTGVVPALGDFTGATIQVGTVVSSQIYNTLQQTLSAINYLNTTPANPNPDFSYIPGQPPYGQANEEQKKQQAQVYAALRTTIIAQLTRIAQQLREAYDGSKRQTDAAATYKGEQDKTVSKFVTDAFGGGK